MPLHPLEEALNLISFGIPVLQIPYGEKAGYFTSQNEPVVGFPPGMPFQSTLDPKTVQAWFGGPILKNLAILSGEPSGLVVLDVDFETGAEQTIAGLNKKYGGFSPTLTSFTGNGYHLFFRQPRNMTVLNKGLSKGGWLRGIDLKATTGMVIVPPSRHPNGKHYQWKDCERFELHRVQEMPIWLWDEGMREFMTQPDDEMIIPAIHVI
jgi:hypothetical protein